MIYDDDDDDGGGGGGGSGHSSQHILCITTGELYLYDVRAINKFCSNETCFTYPNNYS
jgi:hypothetical protein